MNETRIGVVILNYLAYQATIDCVNCFLNQQNEQFSMDIVVVDNASTNESYVKLREAFERYENVYLFQTDHNLGFAGGNNFGYEKLVELGQYDYIIVSNDDILLEQGGLFSWIKICEQKYGFAVLGPSIYSVSGEYQQSPLENFTESVKKAKEILRRYRIILLKLQIKKVLQISEEKSQAFEKWENLYYETVQKNKTLHGAFLIFSKRYFDYYDRPFDSRTFLYMEEYILKLRCDKKKLSMVYSPDYQVKHLQAQSGRMSDKSKIAKQIARQKQLIRSLKVYLVELKEMEND